jgi:phenylalanyl-tRNA synthetase beta chain
VEPKLAESSTAVTAATRVEIHSPELCGRFTARVLRGVTVGPSPHRLRQRLEALGQSSINNVVDATNYVMLELGHALHAFDYDRLGEHRIVVRRAQAGEKIRTLDGQERALTPEMCVVADASRAVGIAGVMGGALTEISSASRNVLLECAWFDPVSVRRTSKALGLRTEASMRFERGADPEMAERASRRCAELIQQLAGGEILCGVVDVYPGRKPAQKISLRRKALLRTMGADVPDAEIEAILTSLGFAPQRLTNGARNAPDAAWSCTQPSWRADVQREIDLIEEVARLYGLEQFPSRLPPSPQPSARLAHAAALERVRERLMGLGYQEIVTITLVDEARDALFRPQGVSPVAIANPLTEDASVLRSTGLVALIEVLEHNLHRGQRNVRVFEIGRAYRWNGSEIEEVPVLTLGATGLAREKSIAEAPREFGFADLKGDLDRIGELAGGMRWDAGGPRWLHPARAATLWFAADSQHSQAPEATGRGVAAGVAGQLGRAAAEQLKFRQDVFLAEIALEPFCAACEAALARRRYQPISRFPAVERDFSLLLPEGTTFAQVRETIASLGISEIVSIEALDLFRGGQVPPGQYSLLVRVTFQSHAGTLTETEIGASSQRLITSLARELGASLRTA